MLEQMKNPLVNQPLSPLDGLVLTAIKRGCFAPRGVLLYLRVERNIRVYPGQIRSVLRKLKGRGLVTNEGGRWQMVAKLTDGERRLRKSRTEEIIKPSPKGHIVGRKRVRPEFKRPTLREKFALRLHDLADAAGNPSYDQIAESCGVSKAAVAKWFNGENTPDMDYWEKLASVLGLKSYRELLPS